jgi:hypothetical protein
VVGFVAVAVQVKGVSTKDTLTLAAVLHTVVVMQVVVMQH